MVELNAGGGPGDLVLVIDDRPGAEARGTPLVGIGGGYGLQGMRERAHNSAGRSSAGLTATAGGSSCVCRAGERVSSPIRVLVADDQALVREGLMTLLHAAGASSRWPRPRDGEEAVALAGRHRPDVVLMDLRMPNLDGVEATRRIRAAPGTEVVVLTTHADEASILDALGAGARGYLTKDAGIAEIARAIHAAAAHQTLLDPASTARARCGDARRAASQRGAGGKRAACTLPDDLTPREAEVLGLIARGLSNAEIAAEAGRQRGDREDPHQPSLLEDRRARPRAGRALRLHARPRRLRAAHSDQSGTPCDRGGAADVVALGEVDAVAAQEQLGLVVLDAFGDGLLVEAAGQRHQRLDDELIGAVVTAVSDELAVDLEVVKGDVLEVEEAAEAGAEVVQREAAAEAFSRSANSARGPCVRSRRSR